MNLYILNTQFDQLITGKFARWEVHLEGGDKCRLKSKESGKFLRIKNGASAGADDKIDVGGGQGPMTLFKIHQQGQHGHVKLESNKQAGLYLIEYIFYIYILSITNYKIHILNMINI